MMLSLSIAFAIIWGCLMRTYQSTPCETITGQRIRDTRELTGLWQWAYTIGTPDAKPVPKDCLGMIIASNGGNHRYKIRNVQSQLISDHKFYDMQWRNEGLFETRHFEGDCNPVIQKFKLMYYNNCDFMCVLRCDSSDAKDHYSCFGRTSADYAEEMADAQKALSGLNLQGSLVKVDRSDCKHI